LHRATWSLEFVVGVCQPTAASSRTSPSFREEKAIDGDTTRTTIFCCTLLYHPLSPWTAGVPPTFTTEPPSPSPMNSPVNPPRQISAVRHASDLTAQIRDPRKEVSTNQISPRLQEYSLPIYKFDRKLRK
jgi:hypothetical protein